MITRYAKKEITTIWADPSKLLGWQDVELAVIEGRVRLGKLERSIFDQIRSTLLSNPIDIKWWTERDEVINHDLAAFIEERMRFLSSELKPNLHDDMTSYDTEESAFIAMLLKSLRVVEPMMNLVDANLEGLADRHRYTIMMARTHGQEAELQSFGKRCLTWLQSLRISMKNLERSKENLRFSRLSGAVGNYTGIDPELEKVALSILGFEPFYGATQIMPREFYAPLAQALCQIVLTLNKIALDIRLGARSGLPIY